MSISSCPRCAQQILIPPGIANTAKVRCPLCRAEYTLSDALVNLPPALEIVDESSDDVSDLSEPEQIAPLASAVLQTPPEADHPDVDDLASSASETVEFGAFEDELKLHDEPAPAHLEHDDLVMQEDTEIEDLGFAPEPAAGEAPVEFEPLELAAEEASIFDEEPAKPSPPSSEDMTQPVEEELDFAEPEGLGDLDAGNAATIDFTPAEESETETASMFEEEPLAAQDDLTAEPSDMARPVEEEIRFDDLDASSESDAGNAATISFDDFEPADEPSAETGNMFEPEFSAPDDEPGSVAPAASAELVEEELRFDAPEDASNEAGDSTATVSFDDFAAEKAEGQEEDIPFEFDAPSAEEPTFSEAPTVEFEHRIAASDPADHEEIELDFAEQVAESPVEFVADAEEQPEAKKGKKKKDKKKKAKSDEADGDAQPRRRSLVGTIVGVLLGAIVGLGGALYGVMWMGKDYDFFNLGPTLAGFKLPLPAEYSKAKGRMVAGGAQLPPTIPMPPATPPANETPAPDQNAAAPPPSEPTTPATTEPSSTDQPLAATEQPATQPPATESAPNQPQTAETNPPAEEKPAPSEPALAEKSDTPIPEPAADKPAADPATDPVGVTAAKPTPDVLEPPSREPAEMPDDPTDRAAPVDTALESPKLDAEPLPAPDQEQPSLVNAPEYSPADLAKAMQDAGAANERMVAVAGAKDEGALKSARARFYLSVFRLAEVLTFTGDASAQDHVGPERKPIERIMMQLAADKKRLDAMKYNAARWLGFSKRTTPGIALAGSVQSCEPVGKLYELKLAAGLNSDEPVVLVLCTENPHLSTGDEALVLGAIVDNPGERVIGYEGDEPLAIWSGMTLALPSK
jgi:hypothetical protein